MSDDGSHWQPSVSRQVLAPVRAEVRQLPAVFGPREPKYQLWVETTRDAWRLVLAGESNDRIHGGGT